MFRKPLSTSPTSEDVRDAVRNVRSDQRVDIAGYGIANRHRYGIVRPVVDESVRFERPKRQNYRLDLCRDKLLKLLPVEIVHRPRRWLLGMNVRRNEKKQRNDKASNHSLASPGKSVFCGPTRLHGRRPTSWRTVGIR